MQETVDVLNREQFIDMLYQLVNTMSDLKQGKIFSIDGTWGYGKTYVLEELERRLSPVVNEDTYDDTVIWDAIEVGLSGLPLRNVLWNCAAVPEGFAV